MFSVLFSFSTKYVFAALHHFLFWYLNTDVVFRLADVVTAHIWMKLTYLLFHMRMRLYCLLSGQYPRLINEMNIRKEKRDCCSLRFIGFLVFLFVNKANAGRPCPQHHTNRKAREERNIFHQYHCFLYSYIQAQIDDTTTGYYHKKRIADNNRLPSFRGENEQPNNSLLTELTLSRTNTVTMYQLATLRAALLIGTVKCFLEKKLSWKVIAGEVCENRDLITLVRHVLHEFLCYCQGLLFELLMN